MPKFRKKPVVIDAIQLRWDTWVDVCDLIGEFPAGMRGVFVGPNGLASDEPQPGSRIGLVIPTLEGHMLATEGDWIIKGVQGEFYPCKPDIFAETYEPA